MLLRGKKLGLLIDKYMDRQQEGKK